MISSKRLVKENTYAVASQFMNFARGLVFNIIFPIIMGPLLFGQYSTIIGYYYLATGLLVGFNYAMMRRVSISRNKEKVLFSYLYSKIITVILIILIMFVYVKSNYPWVSLYSILLSSILLLLLSMMTLLTFYYTSIMKNIRNVVSSLLFSLWSIVIPIIFYTFFQNIESVIAGLVVSGFITVSYLYFPVKNTKINFRELSFKEVIPFTMIFSFQTFLMWGVLLILSLFSTPENIAYLKVALGWVFVIVSIIPISTGVVFASFVNLKRESKLRFSNYVEKTFKYSLILLVPAMFGLYFISPKMISLIYGKEYLQAAMALKILSWAILPLFVNNILVSMLTAMKKEKKAAGIMMFSTFLLLVISFPLSYYYNLIGASSALLSSAYAAMFLMITYLRIRRQIARTLIKPLISSIIMSVFIILIINEVHSLFTGLFMISLSVIIYFLALFILKGVTVNDLRLLRHII